MYNVHSSEDSWCKYTHEVNSRQSRQLVWVWLNIQMSLFQNLQWPQSTFKVVLSTNWSPLVNTSAVLYCPTIVTQSHGKHDCFLFWRSMKIHTRLAYQCYFLKYLIALNTVILKKIPSFQQRSICGLRSSTDQDTVILGIHHQDLPRHGQHLFTKHGWRNVGTSSVLSTRSCSSKEGVTNCC